MAVINKPLFDQMNKANLFDLPILLSYSNGSQITKLIKLSPLVSKMDSLKPYTKLSRIELTEICDKVPFSNAKADYIREIKALLNGEEIVSEPVKVATKPVKVIKASDKPVKQTCSTDCNCVKTESELQNRIDSLELENAKLTAINKDLSDTVKAYKLLHKILEVPEGELLTTEEA